MSSLISPMNGSCAATFPPALHHTARFTTARAMTLTPVNLLTHDENLAAGGTFESDVVSFPILFMAQIQWKDFLMLHRSKRAMGELCRPAHELIFTGTVKWRNPIRSTFFWRD